jgi:hypothetical protein
MRRFFAVLGLAAASSLLAGCPVYSADPCVDSSDCASGYVCNVGAGECVFAPSGGNRCNVSSDCGANSFCASDGYCSPIDDCRYTGCPGGFVCDATGNAAPHCVSGTTGKGGTGGSNSAGAGGSDLAGAGGDAGSAGAGDAGSAGAGDAGEAGAGGEATGGADAGGAGEAGEAGQAGQAGQSGEAGTAGEGGSAPIAGSSGAGGDGGSAPVAGAGGAAGDGGSPAAGAAGEASAGSGGAGAPSGGAAGSASGEGGTAGIGGTAGAGGSAGSSSSAACDDGGLAPATGSLQLVAQSTSTACAGGLSSKPTEGKLAISGGKGAPADTWTFEALGLLSSQNEIHCNEEGVVCSFSFQRTEGTSTTRYTSTAAPFTVKVTIWNDGSFIGTAEQVKTLRRVTVPGQTDQQVIEGVTLVLVATAN